MTPPRARDLGLIHCHHCGALWREVPPRHARCARCGSALSARKSDSIARTWAYLIAACILYVPANLLPVMVTRSLLGEQSDTIMSGIVYFWVSGSWSLAAIVFIASFLVPLLKLAALLLLVVFVVTLLAGLVQLQSLATITAGPGALSFGAVVVLTMLAAQSFDPRLTWDTGDPTSS